MDSRLINGLAVMKTKPLFATLLTLTFLTAGHAQTFDKAKLDQLFDRLFEKNKGMGSLTIAKDGTVLYTRSFGYSQVNGTEKKPLAAETKYRIASITKTYTAVMIFQLVEEGKLNLTDTLDKFFPQIPNASRITMELILKHRGGIPVLESDTEDGWGKQPRTRDEVVTRIAQHQPEFEPDAKYSYSNAGYILLGYVVEKVGGKSYSEALKERITSKIGLRDTYVGTGSGDPSKNEATSYRYMGGWREAAELDFSVPAGAGAILSTPTDMAKFIQALFDLKLVSADSLKQMTTMRDGEGMGMASFTFAGKTLYGYNGGSGSSGAWLAYYPEEKLALAYTTNMKVYGVRSIVTGVFDIYWNRPFQIPALEAFDVSPEVLDRYVGVYTIAGTPAKMTVTRDGATLYIEAGNEQGGGIPLEATAEDKFGNVEFDAAKGQLTIRRGNNNVVFTKQK